MSDVFISYAHADREAARKVAEALVAHGWSVWWDRIIPVGRTWDEVIEEKLDSATCVVVLWSKASVASQWVKSESAEAMRRGVLVPALIEETKIPLEFRRLEAADLSEWSRNIPKQELERLIESIASHVGGVNIPASKSLTQSASPPLNFTPSRNTETPARRPNSNRVLSLALVIGVGVVLAIGIYVFYKQYAELQRQKTVLIEEREIAAKAAQEQEKLAAAKAAQEREKLAAAKAVQEKEKLAAAKAAQEQEKLAAAKAAQEREKLATPTSSPPPKDRKFYLIPTANIQIDGDFGDWQGIQPVLIDQPNDKHPTADLPGTDLNAFYLARDSRYLYLAMTLHDGLPRPDLNTMYFFVANQDPIKLDVRGDRDAAVEFSSGNWSVWTNERDIGGRPLRDATHYPSGYVASGSNFIEWKVPLKDMGNLNGRFVRVYIHVEGKNVSDGNLPGTELRIN